MLELTEDAEFQFDEAAADRPVRFIEKYCAHYEGRHAGKPFILHDVQRKLVRDIFGWKSRATGLRRFTDVYFEAAVGAGKSPLLAAIGLYGLIGDNEPSAQIYSLASSYGQARVVFDTAKRFVKANNALASRLEVVDREIRHPRSGSFWQIVSGKGPGAGCKPSMILGDEVHQWAGAGAYQDLRDRMFKRSQPLLIAATNAGKSRASFCWQLREKAIAALAGTGERTLYPIIFAADEEARTDDPAAWRTANPLMGVTIQENNVRANAAEAMKDADDERNFRRLYMSIWPKAGAGRWLDLADWDACVNATAPAAEDPLYIGLDLSAGDDLCAAGFVSVTPERFHVASRFWLPRRTARHYTEKDGFPYLKWCDEGQLELLDEPTISSAVRKRIAADVIALSKTREVKAVCYDRCLADETIAALEAEGLTCVPVPQGYTLSPGCNALERRLKERSIDIAANDVLRFCAENCEVKCDDRGNIWPIKPNARGRYAGKRGLKIDGITALVTALTEARKHAFPPARKPYKGRICLA
jgi:phage terminase large subunit-like protein